MSKVKSEIQERAIKAHLDLGGKSIIALSVGLGKSKIAIDRIEAVRKEVKNARILFTGARDIYITNFITELKKWSCSDVNIDMICNKSIHNYIDKYDLIIWDEAHKETDLVHKYLPDFIKINPNVEILALTGTPPYDRHPIYSILPISYKYLIEDAVDNGILNDFEIEIHRIEMSKRNESLYNYYYKSYINEKPSASFSPALSKLKMFLNNNDEKIRPLQNLLKQYNSEKVLVYCGSISQSELLKYPSMHSKLDKKQVKINYYNFFGCDKGILVNVGMLKESVSIPHLKYSIVLGIDSSPSSKEQILGRLERLDLHITSKLIFIVFKNTVEEKWVLNGLEKFKNKISYV